MYYFSIIDMNREPSYGTFGLCFGWCREESCYCPVRECCWTVRCGLFDLPERREAQPS